MADTVSAVVGAITKGIQWVRAQYRKFKVWLAEKLVAALEKGWTAALTIAALVATSIVVGYVWQIMMQNALVIAVKNLIKTIGTQLEKLAAFLQIDLIISLMQLGIMVNEKLYKQLAPLYDELGSLAEELELDFNYITTFLEVDRAILQASSALTGFGFLEADTKYVTGLSAWMKKLGKRMSDYAANPQLIFTDIQKAIIQERAEDSKKALGKIWAAIDFAGDWVRGKGQVVLTMVDEIDAQVRKMPADVQEAIKPWYEKAVKTVRDFEHDRWEPFWDQYQKFTDVVEDIFLLYGTDIAEIQRRIDSPLDWLRTLLALPEDERATMESTLDEFIGELFPAALEAKDSEVGAVADSMAEWELKHAADIELLGLPGTGPRAVDISDSPVPTIRNAWYEEQE